LFGYEFDLVVFFLVRKFLSIFLYLEAYSIHGSGEKYKYVQNFGRKTLTGRDKIVWRPNRRWEDCNVLIYILKEWALNIGTVLCILEWGLVAGFNEHLTLNEPSAAIEV
jgi:hypothetical protein